MAKRAKKAKPTRQTSRKSLSTREIAKAIENLERRLQAFKASQDEQKHKDRALRFLGGLKETLQAFCEPVEDIDMIAIPQRLAGPRH
jgi:hypothetical protein